MRLKSFLAGRVARVVLGGLTAAVLAFGSFAALATTDASAAGTVSASLGAGCSASNGMASLRFNVRARSTGDTGIAHVNLKVNAMLPIDEATFTQNYSKSVALPNLPSGNYLIQLTVTTNNTAPAIKQGGAVIAVTANSSSCRVVIL